MHSENFAATATTQNSPYNRNLSLHDVVRRQAHANPEKTAIVHGERKLTYGELDRQSDLLAGRLMRLGVRKGDVVGVFMHRSIETILAYLAALKAGAAYLPLDKAFPTEHLEYVAEVCSPKVIFIDDSHSPDELPIGERGITLVNPADASLVAEDRVEQFPSVAGSDAAYVMFTSGSTGRPKGVTVPHRGAARLVQSQNFVKFRPDDVVLHMATIAFDASTFEIWGALLHGATLAIMPSVGLSHSRLGDVIRQHGVSITLFTTGLFNLFADYPNGDLPTLRHVLFGGEVASVEHSLRFHQAYPGRKLTNVYGPTEGSCMATTFEIPADFTGQEIPIGPVINETGVHILDEDLKEVGPNIEGQLAISGDGVAIGYFNQPELTAEKFVTIELGGRPTRCYLTGDLATVDNDSIYHFRGRRDRQIKINGKRIELEEIEAALRRDSRLQDAAVNCHQQGSIKRLVAYLCPKKPADLDDPDFPRVVMAHLRSAIPAYMVPSQAVVLSELPLTPTGKVERSRLVPPAMKTVSSQPKSRVEELVVRLWKDALASDDVSLERNFFDLGGTSLQLLRVHAGLEAELQQPIDITALFQNPTIRELVQFLEGRGAMAVGAMSMDQRAQLQRERMSQFRRSSS